MTTWVAIYRFAWVLLIVLIAIGLTCIFVPKIHGIRELHRRNAAIETENRKTASRIGELKNSQERIRSDPAFVELTARRMGMAKEGETVVRCTNTLLERASEALP